MKSNNLCIDDTVRSDERGLLIVVYGCIAMKAMDEIFIPSELIPLGKSPDTAKAAFAPQQ